MFPMLVRAASRSSPPLIRDVCPECSKLSTVRAGWWKLNRKTRILLAALRCSACCHWWGVEIPVTEDGVVQLRTFRETVNLASDHLGFKGPFARLLVMAFWGLGRALVWMQVQSRKLAHRG